MLWGQPYHMAHFTGGIDFCARNEKIKQTLVNQFLRRDTSIADAAKLISKTDCLQTIAESTDEYRTVKLNALENHPLITTYLPSNLTNFAYNRIRHRLALGFKDFNIAKQEMGTYLIRHNLEEHFCKVKTVNNYLFCTCMQYFNSGLPCEHILLCSLTHGKKFLIHQRWSLKYEKLLLEMEETSRNSRINSLAE